MATDAERADFAHADEVRCWRNEDEDTYFCRLGRGPDMYDDDKERPVNIDGEMEVESVDRVHLDGDIMQGEEPGITNAPNGFHAQDISAHCFVEERATNKEISCLSPP